MDPNDDDEENEGYEGYEEAEDPKTLGDVFKSVAIAPSSLIVAFLWTPSGRSTGT